MDAALLVCGTAKGTAPQPVVPAQAGSQCGDCRCIAVRSLTLALEVIRRANIGGSIAGECFLRYAYRLQCLGEHGCHRQGVRGWGTQSVLHTSPTPARRTVSSASPANSA